MRQQNNRSAMVASLGHPQSHTVDINQPFLHEGALSVAKPISTSSSELGEVKQSDDVQRPPRPVASQRHARRSPEGRSAFCWPRKLNSSARRTAGGLRPQLGRQPFCVNPLQGAQLGRPCRPTCRASVAGVGEPVGGAAGFDDRPGNVRVLDQGLKLAGELEYQWNHLWRNVIDPNLLAECTYSKRALFLGADRALHCVDGAYENLKCPVLTIYRCGARC